MKYSLIIAVAVLSFVLAIPLSKNSAQPIRYATVSHKAIIAKKVVKAISTPITAVAPAPAPPPPPPPPPAPCDTHECWMAEAGIAPSDYAAANFIVSHESGWNPDATEPYSGAHGLPQALPYGKTGCDWDDPVCQLRWANGYAVSRYGGWWPAQAWWASHGNW